MQTSEDKISQSSGFCLFYVRECFFARRLSRIASQTELHQARVEFHLIFHECDLQLFDLEAASKSVQGRSRIPIRAVRFLRFAHSLVNLSHKELGLIRKKRRIKWSGDLQCLSAIPERVL